MSAKTLRWTGIAGLLFLVLIVLPGSASADDPSFTVVASPDGPASEAAGKVTFDVTFAEAVPDGGVTLSWTVANGTTSADDFPGMSGTVKVDAGSTTAKIDVAVKDDALDEAQETFTLTVTKDGGAANTATGTINDNDPPPVATIGNSPDVTEGNVGGTAKATFTVTLSAVSGRDVSVNYATVDNTAKTPADYTGVSGTLLIPAGATTKDITVNVTGDTASEADETFFVILTPRDGTATVGEPHQGTAKILDDDLKPTLSIAAAAETEGAPGGGPVNLKFKITLSAKSAQPITVIASTHDDTAVAPTDYQFKTESIQFAPGDLVKTFMVQLNDDAIDEENETLLAVLSSPSAGATIADGKGSAVGTIIDDDNTSLLSVSDATANEPTSGTGTMTFNVTLTPPSQRTVRIGYTTANGTASSGSDYTPTSGTLTFSPGAPTTQQVTVQVLGDTVNEDNETVLLNLVDASGALVADAQGQGTIIDENAPPSLSIDDVVTQEGDGAFFTITLAGSTLRTVTVVVQTVDGTATGTDYTPRRVTVTFAPGEVSKSFSVSVLDDSIAEPQETFTATLQDAVNAVITKSRGTATIQASDQQTATQTPGPSTNPTPIVVKPTGKTTALLPRMVLGPRVVIADTAGVARFQMTCAKASPVTCAGSVALESIGKPVVAFGRKPFSVKKGKRATVPIKLSAKAFKLLMQKKTLQARAIVMVKTGKSSLRVVPGVVTLRAPKVPTAKVKTPAP